MDRKKLVNGLALAFAGAVLAPVLGASFGILAGTAIAALPVAVGLGIVARA